MRLRGSGSTRRNIVVLCGAIPVFAAAILSVYRPGFLPRLDDTVYDAVMRSSRQPRPGPHVVIVDVDERSLSTVGQWPWRRDVVARLIARLSDMHAAAVAVDIIFAESDRYGETPADAAAGAAAPAPDDVLAATLREGGVVLGYALTFDEGGRTGKHCVLHPINLAVVQPAEDTGEPPYFHATGAVCSLAALGQAAGRSGFLNAAPDADGILRRVPLVAELDGRRYPSLGVAAVSAVTGARDISLLVSNVNASSLTIDDRVVPLDGKSNLLVRYRGKKKTFPYLSAADVLSGAVGADAVRGKIAFLGTTALGTREVVATPLDTLFAGVEVQATVADNLLERSFIEHSPHERLLDSILVIALGIAFALLFARTSVIPGLLAGATGIGLVWWGSVQLLSSTGIFLSPLFSTIGVTSALIAMTFARFLVERGRAESAGRERTAAQKLMVQTLLSLTETRDLETGCHSRRTQQYARLLSQQLALNPDFHAYLTPERIDLLSSLAPLHDIGKVGIPDHILNKPGALTPEELAEMRSHPVLGRDVILKAEQRAAIRDDVTLAMAKDIVYTHHERWDGTGYPQGLRGPAIPIPGRVMGVVDVYDAAVTRTLYQPSRSHDDVVKMIVKGRGTHFDPAVVDAFVAVADVFKALSDEDARTRESSVAS